MTAPVKFTQDNDVIDRATGIQIGYVHVGQDGRWYGHQWGTFVGDFPTRREAGAMILAAWNSQPRGCLRHRIEGCPQ